ILKNTHKGLAILRHVRHSRRLYGSVDKRRMSGRQLCGALILWGAPLVSISLFAIIRRKIKFCIRRFHHHASPLIAFQEKSFLCGCELFVAGMQRGAQDVLMHSSVDDDHKHNGALYVPGLFLRDKYEFFARYLKKQSIRRGSRIDVASAPSSMCSTM